MKIYSVVIPVYGDAYLAENCTARLCEVFRSILSAKGINDALENHLEIIYVVDGKESDLQIVELLPKHWPMVKVIFLSRNFGQHNAISAGYENAVGKFIVRLNIDCQDPPEELPKLIEAMEKADADQAIGIYEKKASSRTNKITSNLFYTFFNWLSGYKSPLNTSPLRIMKKEYQEVFNSLTEKSRFPQTMDEYLGFKKVYVPIRHDMREDKRSSYTFSKRLKLAIVSAVAFSDRPMFLMINFGLLVFFMGTLFLLYNLYQYFFNGASVSGYTTTIAMILLFSSSIYIAVGILGLYVGDIQREVKNRPCYLIKHKINF